MCSLTACSYTASPMYASTVVLMSFGFSITGILLLDYLDTLRSILQCDTSLLQHISYLIGSRKIPGFSCLLPLIDKLLYLIIYLIVSVLLEKAHYRSQLHQRIQALLGEFPAGSVFHRGVYGRHQLEYG